MIARSGYERGKGRIGKGESEEGERGKNEEEGKRVKMKIVKREKWNRETVWKKKSCLNEKVPTRRLES